MPELGKAVLVFVPHANGTTRGVGWYLAWIQPEGWKTPERLASYRGGGRLVLRLDQVLQWCELPPDPRVECAHKFNRSKCQTCGKSLHDFEAEFYSELDSE